jgi:hypothetical protein
MSDSFADLWSTSASTKSSQTLGSLNAQTRPNSGTNAARPGYPKNDLFSMLSSAGSSAPASRPLTPSNPSTGTMKPAAPVQQQTAGAASGGGLDAFSGLLSPSFSKGAVSSNMTMAQRQALAEQDRVTKLMKSAQAAAASQKRTSPSAWDGLDSLGQSSTPSSLDGKSKAAGSDSLFDDWESPVIKPSTTNSTSRPALAGTASAPAVIVDDDDWGLGNFSSAPSQSSSSGPPPAQPAPASRSKSATLWDMDVNDDSEFSAFDDPSEREPPAQRNGNPQRADSPSQDFEFGDRERGQSLLGDGLGEDDDDLLGALARPVSSFQKSVCISVIFSEA